MAVTIDFIQQLGDYSWLIEYSSDLGGTPTFYIYIFGELFSETEQTSFEIFTQTDDEPVIEIFDDADDVPGESYNGRVRLHWNSVSRAEYYLIEEYIAAAWTEVDRVNHTGARSYDWASRWLEDVATHQFRIKAIDEFANEGTADIVSGFMVRCPSVPRVEYTYSSITNKITITEV